MKKPISFPSIWDLQCSLQQLDSFTIDELKQAIQHEKENRNRITIIKLLQQRINKLIRMGG